MRHVCPVVGCTFLLELDWDGHVVPCILRFGVFVKVNNGPWCWWPKP